MSVKMDLNHLKQEPVFVPSVKSEPGLLMKEDISEDSNQDGNEQQCVQVASTPVGTDSMNEACFTGDLLNVKQELDDMDIGPIVLQHTDIYYTTNKNMSAVKEVNTIVDDGNEAMPCYEVKKESVEDELRGTTIISCKYCTKKTTEEDYNEQLKYVMGQQNGLQQHFLHQHRAKSSNGFKCEACSRVIYKPYLLSSSKTSVTTSTAAGPSNQKQPETAHDETVKTKQKQMEWELSEKRYFSHSSYQSYAGEKSYHCDVNLAQSGDFTKHMGDHMEEKSYQCNICDKRFEQRSGLTQHMRRVHCNKKCYTNYRHYQCNTCDARFVRNCCLTQNMRGHSGEKPYQCDMCTAKFAHRSGLSQHILVHTGKNYQCDMCAARFVHRSGLSQHKRVHTGKKYQCDMCNAQFAYRSSITIHMKVHTGEKPHQCDMCDAKFVIRSGLTKHMRVHTGEKPYQCDMCDAKFVIRSGLTKHMRVHTGEKPYQCDLCGTKFGYRSTLSRHMRIHTGENQCDRCDAKFANRSGLTMHMRVHTGERPYQCEMCNAKFAQRSGLSSHMRVHTGEKPF